MLVKKIGWAVSAALLLSLGAGCKKSSTPDTPPAEPKAPASAVQAPPQPETVARFHWLGLKQIGSDTNTASYIEIWNLPETVRLQDQTLDKLASAFLRSLTTDQTAISNALNTADGLRTLLPDLIQEEWYLEIRNLTNQVGELTLALRLPEGRALAWETNLFAILESMAVANRLPLTSTNRGFVATLSTNYPARLSSLLVTRAGEWTLLGLSAGTNALLADVQARVERDQRPFAPSPTNYWLDLNCDLRQAAAAVGIQTKLPVGWPKISLNLTSAGEHVRTRGQFDFPEPFASQLEPWNMPTNLIRDPLAGFTACRSLGPLLSSLKWWQALQRGPAPDQVYLWAMEGVPFLTFLAVPISGASNFVHDVSQHLTGAGNQWLATNCDGRFEYNAEANRLVWRELMITSPFFEAAATNGAEFVFGGLLPASTDKSPTPPEALFNEILSRTNLVYYDWEMTGIRIEQLLYSIQLYRFLLEKAQVPPASPSVAWLRALEFKLSNSATILTRTSPTQLSLARTSSFGLTALELHLLVDWLESPDYPFGINTLRGKLDPSARPQRNRSTSTNAPAITK